MWLPMLMAYAVQYGLMESRRMSGIPHWDPCHGGLRGSGQRLRECLRGCLAPLGLSRATIELRLAHAPRLHQ